MDELRIRTVQTTDIPAIAAIYRDQVLHGTASWEYDPPDDAEMEARMQAIVSKGYPYWVAVRGNELLGYSYASSYRPRVGYRFVVENSIYIREDVRGQGLGRRLLNHLIASCSAEGFKQMIAVIGDSSNTPSIALHASCGFVTAGVFKNIGYKFGRWLDSVQMQRSL